MSKYVHVVDDPENHVDYLNRKHLYYRICVLSMSINTFLRQSLDFRLGVMSFLNWDTHITLKQGHYYIIRSNGIPSAEINIICNDTISYYKLHLYAFLLALSNVKNFDKLSKHKQAFNIQNIERHIIDKLGYGGPNGSVMVCKASSNTRLWIMSLKLNPFYCLKDLGTDYFKVNKAIKNDDISYWNTYANEGSSHYWSFYREAKLYYTNHAVYEHYNHLYNGPQALPYSSNYHDPVYKLTESAYLLKKVLYYFGSLHRAKRKKTRNYALKRINKLKGILSACFKVDNANIREILNSQAEQKALYNTSSIRKVTYSM